MPGGDRIVAAVAEVGDELGIDPGVIEEAGQVAASEDFIPYAELLAEVTELLISRAGMDDVSAARLAREIVDRAQFHLTFGSNRQNVLGEGFEDLLRMLAVRVAKVPAEKIILRKKANRTSRIPGKPRSTQAHRVTRHRDYPGRPYRHAGHREMVAQA